MVTACIYEVKTHFGKMYVTKTVCNRIYGSLNADRNGVNYSVCENHIPISSIQALQFRLGNLTGWDDIIFDFKPVIELEDLVDKSDVLERPAVISSDNYIGFGLDMGPFWDDFLSKNRVYWFSKREYEDIDSFRRRMDDQMATLVISTAE